MPAPERSGAPDHLQSSLDEASRRSPALHEAMDRLERAVARIHESDAFRAYLAAQARFHGYSWGNVLLIAAQRPEATRVAGFHTWKRLGRHVRKGERGIRIVVPLGSSRPAAREAEPAEPVGGVHDVDGGPPDRPASPAPDQVHPRQVRRFGVGTVFDIDQTDGAPLPTIDVPMLAGEEGRDLYARLERVAHDERLTVEHGGERLGPTTMGVYSPTERLILVRQAAPRQMAKTLAHELAHHVGGAVRPSSEEETTAESVAYVVCARFGLDTGERSFPYVATWSRDRRVFRAALGRIQVISHRIIARIEAQVASDPGGRKGS